MKRVLTVQDISCVGKCSLTAAIPVISAMGIEVCPLPTAILSNHTAFSSFSFLDLTDKIPEILSEWKKQGFHFDAIYTGYLGSIKQIDLVHKILDEFARNDTLVVIDPCMADNGKLYTGFSQDFVKQMAKLCGRANVILPNMTEACFLVSQDYDFLVQTNESITKVMAKLLSLGAQQVILKGVEFSKEKIGVAYCSQKLFNNNFSTNENNMEDMNIYFHHRYDENFHGTGDVFASAVTGALVLKKDIKDAVKIACDFVQESIECTLLNPNYNWYGVDFESALRNLPQKL
ncbi:MAG: pyridoxamine kinase [Spirochaetales bacterium]|nr:pyridoxamine kinase [Spirochaetales bacterium]MDY5913974.1 pyridoxamine kinase [Treponema sp.]